MGMDVDVLRLLAPCAPEEVDGESGTTVLLLSAAQLEKLRQEWPTLIAEQCEVIDMEKLAKDCAIPAGFTVGTWDFSQAKGWASFVDDNNKLPNILVEVDTISYEVALDEYAVAFQVELLSCLRKPFRGSDSTAAVIDNCLHLSVTNFSSTVGERLTELMGEQVMDRAYGVLMAGDIVSLQAMGELCVSPEDWRELVIANMTDPRCVTVIDW